MSGIPSQGVASGMREAARALLAVLEPEQVRELRAGPDRLDTPELREWTYLPGPRPGLSTEGLDGRQREVVDALLTTAHSAAGAELVRGAIEVERHRRARAGHPGPDRYWVRLLGDPGGDEPWGWRLNGHHLAVHVLVTAAGVRVTPHFVGAEPARTGNGPRPGLRPLGPEEDLARELITSLGGTARASALFAATPPDDILTRADPFADPGLLPEGLRYDRLAPGQQRLLERLVGRYLDRAPEAYARECWSDAVRRGLGSLSFAWAGGLAPGDRHYYCVRAPDFLIEYDNTQDDGNHAHSVWRHVRHDWGTDLLRGHYTEQHF
ncbi:DUF3500 domain-containing protein [Streptomyces violaceoruber]|uniref:DUF3500 domain-containing protein n=1 Tax=Streptomyces violaceolatus TaxID=67378 RepID=A0ABN3SR45_9ACTN|nr:MULTISPECIES: DUF3500 domain-containing protein [unclassified Streptomyces]MDX3397535.1 DUF3500 domain-containing protein [Streptomyces sp. ME01-18h]PSK57171.1 hypothetical protein B0E38_02500 [Streptomyces sp. 111WW2]